MKLNSVLTTTTLLALTSASPSSSDEDPHAFIPGGPDDFRGPCPMMNTLANHGFLPRDGRNITKPNAISALKTGLNFDETLAGIMWDQAIIASPEPNATFFTLDDLNRHNVLEHDASISRTDDFFGNNHVFNQSVFDASRKYWTADTLTAQMIANSKLFQQIESRATNPTYRFTNATESFSLGEMAAPFIVFGDINTVTVEKSLVEYFFENERLPTELGWSKKVDTVTLENIIAVSHAIGVATNLLTTDGTPARMARHVGDLHAGVSI
ncbi:Cloroperoxidase [Periconia macrospinosa]|uniref:Cloroperoxidase n=1 Tax=Periconia macrospinosa TaxID=97972 RepID=A0A2V1DTL3_9PLEO|nr:Cloroperoxidase [Periconia macrospinosa]